MKRWLLSLVVVAAVGVSAGLWVRHRTNSSAPSQPVYATPAAPIVPPAANTWPQYTNRQYGFSVRYPAGWHDLGSLMPGNELPKVYSNQTSLTSTDPATVALVVDSAPGTSSTQCYPKLTDVRYQYTATASQFAGFNGTKYLLNPSSMAQQQPQYGLGYLIIRQGRCYDVSAIAGSVSVRDSVTITAELVAQTLRFP